MIGDEITVDGITYESIWDGREGLIPDRESKATGSFWAPTRRPYNLSGRFKGLFSRTTGPKKPRRSWEEYLQDLRGTHPKTISNLQPRKTLDNQEKNLKTIHIINVIDED